MLFKKGEGFFVYKAYFKDYNKNMILYIDTTQGDIIEIRILDNKKVIAQKKASAKYAQAEKLLPLVGKVLKKNKLSFNDIKEIKVNNKGGSFTSLRIGVVTANAIGYALGIPVEGELGGKLKGKKLDVVAPMYSGEPNITIKKKKT